MQHLGHDRIKRDGDPGQMTADASFKNGFACCVSVQSSPLTASRTLFTTFSAVFLILPEA